jgi:peptide/nickel transport system substrate-binding protein
MAGVFLGTSREVAGLRTRHGSGLRSGIYSKTIYAWMNVRASPFDDVRVRRAVNLAVDRNRAVDALGGPDAGTPTCQLLPPGLPGYRPICPFTAGPSPAGAWIGPDRDKAKSLVAAAGRRGTRVVVWAPKDWSAIGRQLVTVLHDLGFRSRLRRFVHLSAIGSAAHAPREHPQIGLNGWIADYPEPAGFLRALIGCSADTGVDPGGVGFSRFCDPGIDAAMERARAAGPAAGTAWRRIEERIARRAPVAPLFNGRFTVVTSARTGNVRFNALSGPLLDEVWVR